MFSVMIPCHRPRPDWLKQTLQSVVSQLDLRQHQVVVVDDASPESHWYWLPKLTKSLGVRLVRHDEEKGGVGTHNACIGLAEQPLVHILHPDDWVLPGFYEHIALKAAEQPDVAMYATEALWVNEQGVPYLVPVTNWLRGPRRFQPLHEGNPLCVAATVVRREAYSKWGGWERKLIHTADWECWCCLVTKGGGAQVHWPLACYRTSGVNHTTRLMRMAENLKDYLHLAQIVAGYMPVDHARFRAYVAGRARNQEALFRQQGDAEAAGANAALAVLLEEPEVVTIR